MSDGITYLLITTCAVGGPWLAMVIMVKARRRRRRRAVELEFANYFPPTAPQRPRVTSRQQITTKEPAKITAEGQGPQVRKPVRALLPPGTGANTL